MTIFLSDGFQYFRRVLDAAPDGSPWTEGKLERFRLFDAALDLIPSDDYVEPERDGGGQGILRYGDPDTDPRPSFARYLAEPISIRLLQFKISKERARLALE